MWSKVSDRLAEEGERGSDEDEGCLVGSSVGKWGRFTAGEGETRAGANEATIDMTCLLPSEQPLMKGDKLHRADVPDGVQNDNKRALSEPSQNTLLCSKLRCVERCLRCLKILPRYLNASLAFGLHMFNASGTLLWLQDEHLSHIVLVGCIPGLLSFPPPLFLFSLEPSLQTEKGR